MAILVHQFATGLNLSGIQIDAQEDGTFEVPDELVGEAVAIGCTSPPAPAPGAPPAALTPPNGNIAQWKAEVLDAEAKRLGVDLTLNRTEMVKAVAAARRIEAEKAEIEAAG